MSACCCNLLSEPLCNLEQVHTRCEASNRAAYSTLTEIQRIPAQWLIVFRCRVCGAMFAEEYPFGEMHGGGPKCLYRIETQDLETWLRSYAPLTPALRQAADDAAFLKSLGEEIGPETCRHAGCARLRVRNSVMCRQHHFEMLKGKRVC